MVRPLIVLETVLVVCSLQVALASFHVGMDTRDAAVPISWRAEPSFPLTSTTRNLVSFNLDWHPQLEGANWGQNASVATIDFQNPRLRKLVSHMSPAILRVGGSEGDDAVFDGLDGACTRSRGGSGVPDPAFCMTTKRWEELLEFAVSTGVGVAYGINVMYGRNCTERCHPQPCAASARPPCSAWDPSNAIAVLEYTAKRGLSGLAGIEVGNEKEEILTPEDYAECMKTMRSAIDRLWPNPKDPRRPLLIGPDENPRTDWLGAMLREGGHVADVVTYHLYPGYGLDPSLRAEITNPSFLDFTRVIASYMKTVVEQNAPQAQLWVGETAAAWHSGEPGITDRFMSGFWFMDQLGVVASLGHSVMCRQCLSGGDYSMLGVNDGFIPKPDYWTGLLHKRLMGERVIASYQNEPASTPYYPNMRGYLHCTPDTAGYGSGTVTFAFINLSNTTTYSISLRGTHISGEPMDTTSSRVEYVLTPGPSGISSSAIELNGKTLQLGKDDSLPNLEGHKTSGNSFSAPPLSYGFVVYPDAHVQGCK